MATNAVQEIRNCNFNVRGSYTNVVSVIQVMTRSCFRRGFKVTSANAMLTQSERMSDLVLRAESFQQIAKQLTDQLRLTAKSPAEYRDLADVLDELSEKTIPRVFGVCIDGGQLDKEHEQRLLVEIACMQGLIEIFNKKRARDRDINLKACTEKHGTRRQRISTLGSLIKQFKQSFWWRFNARHTAAVIREALLDSRTKIRATLYDRLDSVVDHGVPVHHIQIDDFFGAQWFLPQDLCLNRQAFFSVLRFKFQGGPGESVVLSERFGVFRQVGLQMVQAPDWEAVIKEGDDLQLSVLLNQQTKKAVNDPKGLQCPQCNLSDRTVSGEISSDGWVTCLRCNSNWNRTPIDMEKDNWNDPGDQNCPDAEACFQENEDHPGHRSSFRYFSIPITVVGGHSYAPDSATGNNSFNVSPSSKLCRHPRVLPPLSVMPMFKPPTQQLIRGRASSPSVGDRYTCRVCGTSFPRPSALRVHMHTHTGARPFRCPDPDCDATFTVNSNARRHYRLHHGDPTQINNRRFFTNPTMPVTFHESQVLDNEGLAAVSQVVRWATPPIRPTRPQRRRRKYSPFGPLMTGGHWQQRPRGGPLTIPGGLPRRNEN